MKRAAELAVIVIAGILAAQVASAGAGISAKVGTLGYGGDITVGLIPQLSLRTGINMLDLELSTDAAEETGVPSKLTGTIDFQTIPILLDWHPWASAFRISAGIMVNNNEVDLSAIPGATVKFNGTDYWLLNASGKASFKKTAPYVGIGTGNAADQISRWHFACDIGVLFQGEPTIDLNAVASDAALQAALDHDVEEEEKNIQHDAAMFNIYPLISVGVSLTF